MVWVNTFTYIGNLIISFCPTGQVPREECCCPSGPVELTSKISWPAILANVKNTVVNFALSHDPGKCVYCTIILNRLLRQKYFQVFVRLHLLQVVGGKQFQMRFPAHSVVL